MKHKICNKCNSFYLTDECNCELYKANYSTCFGKKEIEIYAHSFIDAVERIADLINVDEPKYFVELFDKPIKITNSQQISKYYHCMVNVKIDYDIKETSIENIKANNINKKDKYDNVELPDGYYRITDDIKAQKGDLYLDVTLFPEWIEWHFIDENSMYLNDEANKFDLIIRKS